MDDVAANYFRNLWLTWVILKKMNLSWKRLNCFSSSIKRQKCQKYLIVNELWARRKPCHAVGKNIFIFNWEQSTAYILATSSLTTKTTKIMQVHNLISITQWALTWVFTTLWKVGSFGLDSGPFWGAAKGRNLHPRNLGNSPSQSLSINLFNFLFWILYNNLTSNLTWFAGGSAGREAFSCWEGD